MKFSKSEAYRHIRHRIITQNLLPGQVLNEKEQMGRYNIGRTPMREILLELRKDGLVKSVPRAGTFVAPLELREFQQVIEIRTNLEGLVGQLAAERITDGQLCHLRKIMQAVDDCSSTGEKCSDELFQFESDFHEVTYEATFNPQLSEMLQKLHGVCARFWYYLVFGEKEILAQINDQRKMLAALEVRDADLAKSIMEKHILTFSNQVKENILGMQHSA
ncbi:MAG: GntR family transcriptional regulator [Desulfuromusa sp.]|nr:GntR family transcriptional regulator [Desulfuromusa sp.]